MQVIIPGKPAKFALRLAAYAPNGPRLGVLPQHNGFEVAAPLNDVPGLKVTYPTAGLNAAFIAGHCEIAVEFAVDGGSWAEPPNARFLRIKRGGDETDLAGSRSYDCPGWAWMLRKVVLYPNSSMVDGKRPFNAVSPGAILQTFIQEGKSRGALYGLSYDFSVSHDSAGDPWTHALTLALESGKDLLAVLINLGAQGVIDWRMQGRTLQVFNPETVLGADRASGPSPVDLRFGRDITEAPDTGTLEDSASAILIGGEAGLSVEVTNPAATAPWGRWETFQSQGGVKDTGTAMLLGQNALERVGRERVQITRGLMFDEARWLPFGHYQPGDYLLAPGDGGVMQSLRLRQITLSIDKDGQVGGNVVLNDRFLERDIRLARQAQGILDGGVSSGGSGGDPAPETNGRIPAAPTGLIVEPDAYLAPSGWAEGQITATWGAVTADVNGVAIDVDSYQVYARRNLAGEVWAQITATEGNDTNATYSPLRVETEYSFKVRATANGVLGAFSAEYVTTIPGDVTPPPPPSAPILATRLGIIYVSWDGLASTGAMPIDFDHVRVWMSDGVNPAEVVGTLGAAGALVVGDQDYGQNRTFHLTALDRAGNESAASTSATIATAALVNTDVIGQVISGANIQNGTINAVDKVVANSITGGHIQALAVDVGHLKANSITADKVQAGAITGAKIAGDAIDGKTITGANIRTAASGRRLDLAPPGATAPEIRLYPSSGANYASISTRDDIYAGEATTVITSSQSQAATYRAQIQMSAQLTRINVMDQNAAQPKGGRLDIASTYGRYGYYAGSPATETFLHTDGTGVFYLRGRYLDEAQMDGYDALSVGTTTIGGSGGSINYMWILYPVPMATLMGVVAMVRDGASGNTKDNTYTPKASACTWNSTSGFQVNLAANSSFELSWWNHRH
ncbi:hypothetical protein ACQP25_17315 [Microtetraspora malaysiensis]|uniref:hypothetical protein n=1 Tax=Microtetraspora malaysiensis TaxID=161358 RepID=UPI003D8F5D16